MDTAIDRLAIIIKDLRRTALTVALSLALATLGFALVSRPLLRMIQVHLKQKLAFFTVAEPFLAHVKVSLAMALFTVMPLIIYCLWRALAKPFSLSKASAFWFAFFTCLLFYGGAFFCYAVTLPYGIEFLLSFQSEQLVPVISVNRFISFVAVFILAFGLIFELPIFMVFTGKTGILSRKTFAKNRRYAVLAISVVAALLTPTPDVINMALMGVPLYLLYELGILVMRLLRID